MSQKSKISLMLGLALLLFASLTLPAAQAQEQPTPTNTPWPTPTNIAQPAAVTHGSIRGMVYADVNGDGKCVGTGVAGETAVAGVTIQFTSSDEKTIITHTTAENGAYELAGAGESYWRVTAQPPAEWIVTSENPLYAPIYPNTLLAADVNFCVQKGTAVYPLIPTLAFTPAAGDYVLPEAGASANPAVPTAPAAPTAPITLLAFFSLGLIALGLIWRWVEVSWE